MAEDSTPLVLRQSLPLSRLPKGEKLELKLRLSGLHYPEELSQLPSGVIWAEGPDRVLGPLNGPVLGSLTPAVSDLGQHSVVSLQLLHAEPTAEAQGCPSDPDRFRLSTSSCSPSRQLCRPGEDPARGPAL